MDGLDRGVGAETENSGIIHCSGGGDGGGSERRRVTAKGDSGD